MAGTGVEPAPEAGRAPDWLDGDYGDGDYGDGPGSILVVLLCPLGDTLFATPALRALRAHLPGARITALCWTANEPLLRHSPRLDEVVACPHGLDLAVAGLRMLDRPFDVGIGLSHFGAWVAPFFRARERVGFNSRRLGRMYTHRVPDNRDVHAVRYCLGVVGALGVPPAGEEMEVFTSLEDEAAAAGLLAGRPRPFTALHPGGEHFPGKRWPVERFAWVGRRLLERRGGTLLLVGGEEDRPLAASFLDQAGPAGVLDLTGRLTLLQTAALLRRADVFLGNDSGPLHLAEAVGTPSVALFGPSNPVHFAPLDPRHRVVVGSCSRGRRCLGWMDGPLQVLRLAECRCGAMERIDPQEVLARVETLLAARETRGAPESPETRVGPVGPVGPS